VIRSLSIGEIRFRDIFRVLWKEFRIALLCGLTMAIVVFAKCMLIDRAGFLIAGIVSVTMLCTVLVAKIAGCSLPILAKRLGLDPAVMASPFITTAVDTISMLIYFRIVSIVLGL
jgi:magnesium transporter